MYLYFEFAFGSLEAICGRAVLAQNRFQRCEISQLFHFQYAVNVHKVLKMSIFAQRFQPEHNVSYATTSTYNDIL